MEEYAGGCVWSITDYMSRIELMILNDEVELFNYHVRYIYCYQATYIYARDRDKSDLRNVSRRTWTHKPVFFSFFSSPKRWWGERRKKGDPRGNVIDIRIAFFSQRMTRIFEERILHRSSSVITLSRYDTYEGRST